MTTSAVRSSSYLLLAGLGLALVLGAACGPGGEKTEGKAPARKASEAAFRLEEATIAGLQELMASGKETSVSITALYLERIAAVDQAGPGLNAVIEVNPEALSIARELDSERREKGPRGPMHGIPVLIKDNIDTADGMETTAGSLALLGSKPAKDAAVVERMRAAGAVILGKTNRSEWANFRSSRSTSGWSGRGGQTHNPYALDRNPSGSSSGSGAAVSANLAAVAVGTETDGSIVSPASCCGVVGLKPTVGLVSRSGIVPIAHSQDTAGPMARTVADAATLLGAMTGPDPADGATMAAGARVFKDYREFLDPEGLRGARIGVMRSRAFNFGKALEPILDGAVEAMRKAGAEIVDPVEIPTLGETDDAEYEVLLYEFKADLEAYFAARPGAAVKTLDELAAWNLKNADREMPYFGQEIVERAAKKGPLTARGPQARCARRPDERAGPHDRPRQRRFVLGQLVVAGGRGRVPDDHAAGGLGARAARGRVAHRRGLEGARAHQAGLRLGAGPRRPPLPPPPSESEVGGQTPASRTKSMI